MIVQVLIAVISAVAILVAMIELGQIICNKYYGTKGELYGLGMFIPYLIWLAAIMWFIIYNATK